VSAAPQLVQLEPTSKPDEMLQIQYRGAAHVALQQQAAPCETEKTDTPEPISEASGTYPQLNTKQQDPNRDPAVIYWVIEEG
jgi:hypothetical protein